jgi:hypothetical protein
MKSIQFTPETFNSLLIGRYLRNFKTNQYKWPQQVLKLIINVKQDKFLSLILFGKFYTSMTLLMSKLNSFPLGRFGSSVLRQPRQRLRSFSCCNFQNQCVYVKLTMLKWNKGIERIKISIFDYKLKLITISVHLCIRFLTAGLGGGRVMYNPLAC